MWWFKSIREQVAYNEGGKIAAKAGNNRKTGTKGKGLYRECKHKKVSKTNNKRDRKTK